VFLGFLRIAAVEVHCGTDPTIQIVDDDVVAVTRLIDLLLLISTTFPYLCDCRLGDAEACDTEGNCHTNECNSDTAQSLLPHVHRLNVRSHRSALARLPEASYGRVTPGPLPDISPNDLHPPFGLASRCQATADRGAIAKALGIGRASVYRMLEADR
jgi:hypothetical protein